MLKSHSVTHRVTSTLCLLKTEHRKLKTPRAMPDHIPLELLQTFIRIADLNGDATTAAQELGISQPTISKRLAALRRLTSEPDREPWLLLMGKRWKVTDEGQRIRGIVADLVHRYDRMQRFVATQHADRPIVSIACGQQAAIGFVKTAIERFLKDYPDWRVRLATPRGKARIEGVAGGQYDMAIVTDSPATIHRIARMELHIETLFEDHFVLVANPKGANWARQWNALPTDRPVTAKELTGLPFILPEPDSTRRQQFDDWYYKATGQLLDVVLETGGWQTIIDYANSGLGIGFVTQSSVASTKNRPNKRLTTRALSAKDFPPDGVRLIARKVQGKDAKELNELQAAFVEYICKSATQ